MLWTKGKGYFLRQEHRLLYDIVMLATYTGKHKAREKRTAPVQLSFGPLNQNSAKLHRLLASYAPLRPIALKDNDSFSEANFRCYRSTLCRNRARNNLNWSASHARLDCPRFLLCRRRGHSMLARGRFWAVVEASGLGLLVPEVCAETLVQL